MPFARRFEQIQSPTLPLPPPRDAKTTEAFLSWIANMPRDRTHEVRDAIAAITEKSLVSATLSEQLLKLPCMDAGRHLLLLSTIGELREQSSTPFLERFTWLSDNEISNEEQSLSRDCSFSASGMLQARAAEMLVWVLQGKKDDVVLRIIREHPSRAVRMAAVDAYLFQRGDSTAVMDFLRGQVAVDDLSMIGLPRFGAETDPKTFERLTKEHDAAHPTHAPAPVRSHPQHNPSLWIGVCAVGLVMFCLFAAVRSREVASRKQGASHVH